MLSATFDVFMMKKSRKAGGLKQFIHVQKTCNKQIYNSIPHFVLV
ncbi:hypothetical protein BACCELL_00743 [Bacteroides cellulosilyticus DSM 14838]|uniref:Uncharacterized protein n=1 Tax=Bacteroides cellulosilyticus DSM 14838 TaxID=537012 RepID=E2N8Z8_9BACE|nr:hypothetical protein BACCELL_00743 [Bacteroides cellulosilyticus DSM 14838]